MRRIHAITANSAREPIKDSGKNPIGWAIHAEAAKANTGGETTILVCGTECFPPYAFALRLLDPVRFCAIKVYLPPAAVRCNPQLRIRAIS
ncbi:unnamed protein product, partial [Iphiclides podalirius]